MSRRVLAILCVLLTATAAAQAADRTGGTAALDSKLDRALVVRANGGQGRSGQSRIIVRTVDGRPATALIHGVRGVAGRYFPWLGGQVAVVPDGALYRLASRPEVAAMSLDRAVQGAMDRTTVGIGARWVTEHLGVTGLGVGVATVDSGVNASHHDLDGRIVHFADFVNAQPFAYDDYGHGTHVAGIIAGGGQDSGGGRRGVAPGAHLVVLKALDVTGNGFASNVIAAIDYAIANRATYNIRILNLSVAAGVYESFTTDPLTLAAKRAVDSGIVVVAAAGNRGRDLDGQPRYGGIASPGNAPWVLTVGASSDLGTTARRDDVVAGFSSRGPAAIDEGAKPDLVAPGVNIESTADPSSALYAAHQFSRSGSDFTTSTGPYLSLTGTSMAAPVVAGAIALMLEANADLTPNAVKAILEYTAEARTGYDSLTQGAGFLNARGAVELARAFAGRGLPSLSSDPVPWSRHILWGNRRIAGGMLGARASAWTLGVTWGDMRTPGGQPIGWGVACREGEGECFPESPEVPVVEAPSFEESGAAAAVDRSASAGSRPWPFDTTGQTSVGLRAAIVAERTRVQTRVLAISRRQTGGALG